MRYLLFALLGLFALNPGLRAADDDLGLLGGASDGPPSRMTVRADSTAITPGGTVNLLFDFTADAGWHAYWQNPGAATGLPIKPAWKLPPGFTAGPLQHPDPHRMKFGDQDAFYGFEGRFPLAATITAPADLKPGSKTTLVVDFTWLVCDDKSCLPGDAKLSVELAVAAAAAPVPEVVRALADFRASRAQPPGASWKISGRSDGKNAILTLAPGPGAVAELRGARYLSSDRTVFAEPAQALSRNSDGSYTLTAPLNLEDEDKFSGVKGLLFAESGWTTGSASKFIAIPEGGGSTAPAIISAPLNQGLLLTAFLGGLILNIMPCVFPVIGIKVLGIVEQSGSSKGKVMAHGLAFTSGVLIAFWILAGTLIFLKSGGESVGWGFQMQNPYFIYLMAAFVLVFALNLSGLFEIGQSLTGVGQNAQSQSGLKGTFMSGLFATVVATPCSAPFLGVALTAASTMATVNSLLMFTVIGLGLSSPYLLLGVFPQLVDRLPRPGPWMETFKKLMAFPLYGTAAYLAWILGGLTEPLSHLLGLLSLCVLAMAAFTYGHWCAPHLAAGTRRKGLIVTALLAGAALFAGWPQRPSSLWAPWTKDVERETAATQPVYVDFTARWCATCQTNKLAYTDSVKEVAKRKGIVFLKADWTDRNATIAKELLRHGGRDSIPFNVLYVPGRPDPLVFPNLLTPGALLEEFNKLPDAPKK